jgi:hypothetical protein
MIDKTQRVSPKECEEAWLIFSDRDKYLALSDEEQSLVDAFIEAGHMKDKSGVWPTLGEVYEKWRSEAEERERKRLSS